MKKIVFACKIACSGGDYELPLLVASIRRFGGKFAQTPIWVFVPSSLNDIPQTVYDQVSHENIEFIPFSLEEKLQKFPLGDFVLAASQAEDYAKGKTELLAWLDSATIFFNEPSEFLLNLETDLGYRPVHHTLVGSRFSDPLDSFWRLIYEKCNVSESNIFPMQTHVDGEILRPYFNAGMLISRPETGLFRSWWNLFNEWYLNEDFLKYYKENELYAVFIHQAILAGVILSRMKKERLYELPFSYNYPLNLYWESKEKYKPRQLEKLISVRYCNKLQNLQFLEDLPLSISLKSWIRAIISPYLNNEE